MSHWFSENQSYIYIFIYIYSWLFMIESSGIFWLRKLKKGCTVINKLKTEAQKRFLGKYMSKATKIPLKSLKSLHWKSMQLLIVTWIYSRGGEGGGRFIKVQCFFEKIIPPPHLHKYILQNSFVFIKNLKPLILWREIRKKYILIHFTLPYYLPRQTFFLPTKWIIRLLL